jgi:hypothetical protein
MNGMKRKMMFSFVNKIDMGNMNSVSDIQFNSYLHREYSSVMFTLDSKVCNVLAKANEILNSHMQRLATYKQQPMPRYKIQSIWIRSTEDDKQYMGAFIPITRDDDLLPDSVSVRSFSHVAPICILPNDNMLYDDRVSFCSSSSSIRDIWKLTEIPEDEMYFEVVI